MVDATEFVILGTQRTGTTLVRTTLASHPDILCCGEVFNLGKKPYSNDDGYWKYSTRTLYQRLRSSLVPRTVTGEYLDQLFSAQTHSAIGFKLMLSHFKARPYTLDLLKNRKIRAILVSRRNALKTLISRRTAAASGVYHVSDSLKVKSAVRKWDAKHINLDCNSLLSDLSGIVNEIDEWRFLLGNSFPIFELVYEDYVQNQNAKNRELQSFLKVIEKSLKSDLKKINPDKLEQLVSNFGDVRQTLNGTEYAQFLDL